MQINLNVVAVWLIALLVKPSEASMEIDGSCSRESKQTEELCATYCYKVVKPLLNYATLIRTKEERFAELENKIREQVATNENLRNSIRHKTELNSAYMKTISMQNDLLVSHRKSLVANDALIASLQAAIKSKDDQINRIEKEQNHLPSSCVGKSSDVHVIKVDGMEPFPVLCDSKMAGTGWTVIQRRIDGGVSFNRLWEEYKMGFGNMYGNYFIGLEKLHRVTQSQPHELYIHLEDFQNDTRYAKYSHFAVGSEQDLYNLKSVGIYSGNAQDSLMFQRAGNFSTPDRDNDLWSSGSCAKAYESGWWFVKCYNCNLNGRYATQNTNTDVDGIEWRDWHHRPLRHVQMMIRPKVN